MQEILGLTRSAVTEFDMISDGDKIAVGVSGGKDSLVLLYSLYLLKRFIGVNYDIVALTLDPCFNNEQGDYSKIEEFCEKLGIKYVIRRTNIAEIVFDIRKEKFPCSLCARMRHGALHDMAIEEGCNKIALGHHKDDAAETFLMNLFTEGRIGCYSPKSYLSRKNLTMIRPLCFASEKAVRSAALRNELPVAKSKCPADTHTNREKMKMFIAERSLDDKYFCEKIFGAMRRANIDGWGGKEYEKRLKDNNDCDKIKK